MRRGGIVYRDPNPNPDSHSAVRVPFGVCMPVLSDIIYERPRYQCFSCSVGSVSDNDSRDSWIESQPLLHNFLSKWEKSSLFNRKVGTEKNGVNSGEVRQEKKSGEKNILSKPVYFSLIS